MSRYDADDDFDWNDEPSADELPPKNHNNPPEELTQETAIQAWVEFIEKYENDPVAFAEEVLGIVLMAHQRRILDAVGRRKRRIAIRSGHRVGKTLTLAILAVWHLVTKYPQKTIITAPTSPQLFNSLFPEIMTLCKRLPDFIGNSKTGLLSYYTDMITLKSDPDGSFLAARTADPTNPEGFQGIHSENVLFIWDEASGIDERLFNAARGSMASPNACRVLAGNPTRLNNTFHKAFTTLAEFYEKFHVSSIGLPTVDPDFIREVREEFGVESTEYAIRILGDFPETDEDSYISNAIVKAARKRFIVEPPMSALVYGVDPGGGKNRDNSVITRRAGLDYIRDQVAFRNKNTMQLVGEIVAMATEDRNNLIRQYKEYNRSLMFLPPVPALIVVDIIGIGQGVGERLAELGFNVLAINASESTPEDPLCHRVRDLLWKNTRKFLDTGKCKIPDEDLLQTELTQAHYEYSSGGVLMIESKKSMKKRGLRSPDRADSLALTMMADPGVFLNFGRDDGGTIGYGTGPKTLMTSRGRPTTR